MCVLMMNQECTMPFLCRWLSGSDLPNSVLDETRDIIVCNEADHSEPVRVDIHPLDWVVLRPPPPLDLSANDLAEPPNNTTKQQQQQQQQQQREVTINSQYNQFAPADHHVFKVAKGDTRPKNEL